MALFPTGKTPVTQQLVEKVGNLRTRQQLLSSIPKSAIILWAKDLSRKVRRTEIQKKPLRLDLDTTALIGVLLSQLVTFRAEEVALEQEQKRQSGTIEYSYHSALVEKIAKNTPRLELVGDYDWLSAIMIVSSEFSWW